MRVFISVSGKWRYDSFQFAISNGVGVGKYAERGKVQNYVGYIQ